MSPHWEWDLKSIFSHALCWCTTIPSWVAKGWAIRKIILTKHRHTNRWTNNKDRIISYPPPPPKKQLNTSSIQPGGRGVGDSGGDGSGGWCRQRTDIHTDITGNDILHGAVTAYYPAEENHLFTLFENNLCIKFACLMHTLIQAHAYMA